MDRSAASHQTKFRFFPKAYGALITTFIQGTIISSISIQIYLAVIFAEYHSWNKAAWIQPMNTFKKTSK